MSRITEAVRSCEVSWWPWVALVHGFTAVVLAVLMVWLLM